MANERHILNPEDCVPVEVDGIERVELIVRNIGGEGVLFTADGKMLGHQIASAGHYYYLGPPGNRRRMYRATFLVDTMKSDVPGGQN